MGKKLNMEKEALKHAISEVTFVLGMGSGIIITLRAE